MNMKLIQLLDCDGEFLALYAYNRNLMDNEEAGHAINYAYGKALSVLREANEDEDEMFGPGDVEGDADEALSMIGIERTHAEGLYSKHF